MLVFCRHVVWVVLTSNLCRGGVGTQEENIEAGLEVLRYTLTQWYKERARLHPEEELTRISKVTRKMVGESGKRKLKTKAAETWGLILFLRNLLRTHGARIPDSDSLLEAAESMVE